jgi:hypothetical protein
MDSAWSKIVTFAKGQGPPQAPTSATTAAATASLGATEAQRALRHAFRPLGASAQVTENKGVGVWFVWLGAIISQGYKQATASLPPTHTHPQLFSFPDK